MKTSQKIIDFISRNGQATGKELTSELRNITSRAVRKQLKNLLEKEILRKIGRPPKVYYLLAEDKKNFDKGDIDEDTLRIINNRYLFITPIGEAKRGWEGFIAWCEKTKQDPIKTAKEYVATVSKFDHFRKNNLIDGMSKMKQTFKEVFLDNLFYLDFYSIERFGKTKLGQMLLYAKQSQNISLMHELIEEIRPKIIAIIKKYNIDGVLFVPPTVKREIQFMKVLEEQIRLPIKKISVAKIRTQIIIPQKTLSRLEDRIENARQTIIVEDVASFKNILLLDDAVGSGATLNEVAKQIRDRRLVTDKIIGLAITGSFKGFDVISEI